MIGSAIGNEACRQNPGLLWSEPEYLIPVLQHIQDECRYLPREALTHEAAENSGIPCIMEVDKGVAEAIIMGKMS